MTDPTPTRAEVEALAKRLRLTAAEPREMPNHRVRRYHLERLEASYALRALSAENQALRERAEAAEQCAKLAEACLVQPTLALNAAWKAGRDAALLIMNDDPTGKTAVRTGEYPRWFADRYNTATALTAPASLSAALAKIAQEG